MSSRVIKVATSGAKKVPIVVAEEIQEKGLKCVIVSIDPHSIAQTPERVAIAFNREKSMNQIQKS